MLARFYSATFFAAAVFVIGAAVAILAQLLGPWFLPLAAAAGVVWLIVFVFENVIALLSQPEKPE